VEGGEPVKPLSFSIHLKAQNTLNSRKHWAVKSREVAAERTKVGLRWLGAGGEQWLRAVPPALVVTLTRVGPRELDGDNLQGALKGVRDAVARRLKVDDSTPLVTWGYAQERGEYAVRVEIRRAEVGT
jgi:hypothetical protein